jgi:hypothetical protein
MLDALRPVRKAVHAFAHRVRVSRAERSDEPDEQGNQMVLHVALDNRLPGALPGE